MPLRTCSTRGIERVAAGVRAASAANPFAVSIRAAPTLVLVGAEDVVTPVSCSRELVERIPGARLQVLERGGHVPHWEYPEAVAAALLGFLAAWGG